MSGPLCQGSCRFHEDPTLLGRIGAHQAGYATIMFPVVPLVLSILFEGLEIDATTILGTVFVLAGNLFVLNPMGPAFPVACISVENDIRHLY